MLVHIICVVVLILLVIYLTRELIELKENNFIYYQKIMVQDKYKYVIEKSSDDLFFNDPVTITNDGYARKATVGDIVAGIFQGYKIDDIWHQDWLRTNSQKDKSEIADILMTTIPYYVQDFHKKKLKK